MSRTSLLPPRIGSEAYCLEAHEVLAEFEASPSQGLSSAQAREALKRYGPNVMPSKPGTPFYKLVLKQFEDLLVLILLGAAVVSLVLGFLENDSFIEAIIEPSVIMIILILNACVGVYQESSAEEAIEKLKEYEAQTAVVLRDSVWETLPKAEVVPGDIIKLAVGDKIPADARLIELISQTIRVDESTLTGEAEVVFKHVDKIQPISHVTDQEKRNMLFAGTLVSSGSATAVTCLTGEHTSLGAIQKSLEMEDDSKTPLEEKLDDFAELLSKIILVICLIVWLINIGHFSDPEHGGWFSGMIYYFKIAVALAVAAIPEGLPAVVTTCLALGTMKMAKENAIVRSLPSVETLGCVTVICSDKTGTLTTNKMCVKKIKTFNSKGAMTFDVEGETYEPIGRVTLNGHVIGEPAADFATIEHLAKISVLCNQAELTFSNKSDSRKNNFDIKGVPTEAALKCMAEKLGVPDKQATRNMFNKGSKERANQVNNWYRQVFRQEKQLEFTRDRKSMGTFERNVVDQSGILCVKGAPEGLVKRSSSIFLEGQGVVPLNSSLMNAIELSIDELSKKGLRVLACCYKNLDHLDLKGVDVKDYCKIESDLIFVGLVGIIDPPRPEVSKALRECEQAKIRVIVITGDNPETAKEICRQIGIFGEKENLTGRCYTGGEFMSLTPSQKIEAVNCASLFSRVEPIHKFALVELLRKQGEVVAMTGDGVNDAPALKRADIGIAMGSGTAVAREASDMVLADDNFATIVNAVKEGRAIYANTKQFIRYLISSNIGEVACIFFTAAIGMPEALIPVQLLWVNLVTDGLPATALGFNKPDPDIMRQRPRGRGEKIIDSWTFVRYMVIGLYIGFATVGGFIYWYLYYADGPQITYEQLTNFHKCGYESEYSQRVFGDMDCEIFKDNRPCTISLTILVAIEMLNTFNALSENQSLLVVPPWANPWVGLAVTLSLLCHCLILYVDFFVQIFQTAPIDFNEWTIVINFSLPIIFIDEILKFMTRQVATRKEGTSKKMV